MIKAPAICKDCLITLTDQEKKHYHCRCENCQSDYHRQIEHWGVIKEDAEFLTKITIH